MPGELGSHYRLIKNKDQAEQSKQKQTKNPTNTKKIEGGSWEKLRKESL